MLVNGISMEPGFHTGDLAIMRLATNYQVGDIVAYADAQMNANVIHRIIGIEGDRFVLQGDNNSWIDAYRPTRAEIVGKLWLHLVQLGAAVKWVQSPLNLALAAGLLGGFFMLTMIPRKSGKKGKNKKQSTGNPAGMVEMALYLFGFLALVFGGLAIFGFTRPLQRAADPIKYQQSGAFFYSAAGAPGVYDGEAAASGEPVFTKLACTLNLGFTYTLEGDALGNIAGMEQLSATLPTSQSRWSRSIPWSLAQNLLSYSHQPGDARPVPGAVYRADVEQKPVSPGAVTLISTPGLDRGQCRSRIAQTRLTH